MGPAVRDELRERAHGDHGGCRQRGRAPGVRGRHLLLRLPRALRDGRHVRPPDGGRRRRPVLRQPPRPRGRRLRLLRRPRGRRARHLARPPRDALAHRDRRRPRHPRRLDPRRRPRPALARRGHLVDTSGHGRLVLAERHLQPRRPRPAARLRRLRRRTRPGVHARGRRVEGELGPGTGPLRAGPRRRRHPLVRLGRPQDAGAARRLVREDQGVGRRRRQGRLHVLRLPVDLPVVRRDPARHRRAAPHDRLPRRDDPARTATHLAAGHERGRGARGGERPEPGPGRLPRLHPQHRRLDGLHPDVVLPPEPAELPGARAGPARRVRVRLDEPRRQPRGLRGPAGGRALPRTTPHRLGRDAPRLRRAGPDERRRAAGRPRPPQRRPLVRRRHPRGRGRHDEGPARLPRQGHVAPGDDRRPRRPTAAHGQDGDREGHARRPRRHRRRLHRPRPAPPPGTAPIARGR
ncbi:hypothetical protein GA0115246_111033 [Streptomyces sp. SolWspMP-sol7th]|nr:hypothetical protein GA0115246_111033 [Streptomyces sp. SolWspMP-sol7th]